MNDEIRVRVIGPKDRPCYQLRAFRGRRCIKTKSTTIENTGRKRERTAADREAAVWEDELRSGRYQDPSKITWAEFEDAYLDAMEADGKTASTTRLNHTTFKFVRDILHPNYLRDVTTERLNQWKKELSKGRSHGTVGIYSRHLKAALRWAAENELIPEAPRLKTPKSAGRKGDPVTPEEHGAILAHVEAVIQPLHVDAWRFFLRGLWYFRATLRRGPGAKLGACGPCCGDRPAGRGTGPAIPTEGPQGKTGRDDPDSSRLCGHASGRAGGSEGRQGVSPVASCPSDRDESTAKTIPTDHSEGWGTPR